VRESWRPLLPLAALLLLGSCRTRELSAAEPARSALVGWTDPSPHLVADAQVNGLRINYLDWGGSGPPLVMVHGIGGNPHVFDDLAPLLKDRFHVLAYARRGHGDSDAPARGYDVRTLTSDLRRFLDQLRIDRAHLLGWSTGGNEITRLANLAPDRVDKLVYLEAGYDWADADFLPEFGKLLRTSAPTSSDCASLEAYRAWYQNAWVGEAMWTPGLEAFLRDTVRVNPGGRVEPRMPDDVAQQLFDSLAGPARDYTRVRAPALAVYATMFFPADLHDLDRSRRVADFERRVAGPFRAASMERVRRELQGVTVRQLDSTTHMSSGVRYVDTLAAAIKGFLLSEPQASSARP
jgi:pimeloyl-ACP methyl ester carboxylesterase